MVLNFDLHVLILVDLLLLHRLVVNFYMLQVQIKNSSNAAAICHTNLVFRVPR